MRFLEPTKLKQRLEDPNLEMDEIIGLAPKFVNFVPTQSVLNQLLKKMREISNELDADEILWKGFFIIEKTTKTGEKVKVYQPHQVDDTFSRFGIYLAQNFKLIKD